MTLVAGIALGLLYGLFASSIVMLYKGTGVVNFAQGSVAVFSTFVAYETWHRWHLPLGIAVALALVSGPLAGLLLYEALIARRQSGGSVNLTTRTLGAYLLIGALIEYFWGQGQPFTFPALMGRSTHVSLGPIIIGSNDLTALAAAVLVGPLVAIGYKYTNVGLRFRALAANRTAAISIGMEVRRLERVAWLASGLVAVVVGIVTAPAATLSTGMMDIYLLYAFAAAIVGGGLESVGGAFVAGTLIGCVQDIATLYLNGDVAILIVFGLLVVTLVLRPGGLFGIVARVRV